MKTETLIRRLTKYQPRHYGGGTVVMDDGELSRFAGMLGSVAAQLPYATARALTATAFAARDALVKQVPKSFHERTDWTRRGFHVDPARKTDTPQQAAVGSMRPYMAAQAEGGTRLAKDQQGTVAVPIAARRVLSDILTPRTWPRALLRTTTMTARQALAAARKSGINDPHAAATAMRGVVKSKVHGEFFVGRLGDTVGLWQARNREIAPGIAIQGSALRPLLIYKFMDAARIRIRPRFPFGPVVEAAARTAFPPLFEHWLFAALEGKR